MSPLEVLIPDHLLNPGILVLLEANYGIPGLIQRFGFIQFSLLNKEIHFIKSTTECWFFLTDKLHDDHFKRRHRFDCYNPFPLVTSGDSNLFSQSTSLPCRIFFSVLSCLILYWNQKLFTNPKPDIEKTIAIPTCNPSDFN